MKMTKIQREMTNKAELESLARAWVWGAVEADLTNPIVGLKTATIEFKNEKNVFKAILDSSNYHYFTDEVVRQNKRRAKGLKAFDAARKAAERDYNNQSVCA